MKGLKITREQWGYTKTEETEVMHEDTASVYIDKIATFEVNQRYDPSSRDQRLFINALPGQGTVRLNLTEFRMLIDKLTSLYILLEGK